VRIVVLGAGRVGAAIVRDLAADAAFDVTAADRADHALRPLAAVARVHTVTGDLADPAVVARLAETHDLVVGALPSSIGYQALEAAIDVGRTVVDISFFDEDAFRLDAAARRRGVTAVVDAGISPGLSNLIFGREAADAEWIERFVCYVGGLPADRSGVFEYKAPFSPKDVIELYTRPARFRRAGVLETAPALSDRRPVEFPGVGALEAFLTDGLRTLLREADVPDMREMTLRYPGHVAKVEVLRDIGLFDTVPLDVDGARVAPRALAERLLFPLWSFEPEEADLTVFRVEVDARRAGRRARRTYDLVDRYDAASRTSSMARTTGYTCTALVRLVASGAWHEPGITPPEAIGRNPAAFDAVLRDLAARDVRVTTAERLLPGE
jgi:saccharopine dehydrogenase-like NADP-dependent oxidoreductase